MRTDLPSVFGAAAAAADIKGCSMLRNAGLSPNPDALGCLLAYGTCTDWWPYRQIDTRENTIECMSRDMKIFQLATLVEPLSLRNA